MKNRIIKTKDGSESIYVPELDEHYHSVNGAIQESEHIFINNGLRTIQKKTINVLEAGFGTGLNALLSLKYIEGTEIQLNYTGIEKYPVDEDIVQKLNYPQLSGISKSVFLHLHQAPTGEWANITDNFNLCRYTSDIKQIPGTGSFDLVYFDAFAPDKQPDLWTVEVFQNIWNRMNLGGIFVTYSAKGTVKRALRASGFEVKRLAGPPGKRHMLRCIAN
ncbi:MAG: tRNA (5-methylaminomethyl-2-thiouridine)(34)-methyltransferase MnmD [Bacteroidota bacterium]|nr:tRNA (5-methylaminomethyl-2-thiouridine)(34)-methyltransferase MnmD [Bacteroidota bacterium]